MNDNETFRELQANPISVDNFINARTRQNRRTGIANEQDINPVQALYLNDSLRSWESGSLDQSEGSLSLDDGNLEDQNLLGVSAHPTPNILGLYRLLYDYLRHTLAAFLFIYSFFLLFGDKGQCYSGAGSLKKLPPIRSIF